jgi:hypothetical protein
MPLAQLRTLGVVERAGVAKLNVGLVTGEMPRAS